MVFQEQSLLTNLTVGENIYLGNEAQFTRFGLVDWRALYAAAARQLEKVKVDVDPRTRADDLSFAARQMVELAKALTLEEHAAGHLVILLDEPTSVLERAEIDILFARVRALEVARLFRLRFASARRGAATLRPHLCHEGWRGRRRTCGADADVTTLHRLMVGQDPAGGLLSRTLCRSRSARRSCWKLEQLSLGKAYRDVSFKLRAGEILGIAGVIGSGREELTRTLAGFAAA